MAATSKGAKSPVRGRQGSGDTGGVARKALSVAERKPIGKQPRGKGEREQRMLQILEILDALHPNPQCALDHSNAFELLVATILSAQ